MGLSPLRFSQYVGPPKNKKQLCRLRRWYYKTDPVLSMWLRWFISIEWKAAPHLPQTFAKLYIKWKHFYILTLKQPSHNSSTLKPLALLLCCCTYRSNRFDDHSHKHWPIILHNQCTKAVTGLISYAHMHTHIALRNLECVDYALSCAIFNCFDFEFPFLNRFFSTYHIHQTEVATIQFNYTP